MGNKYDWPSTHHISKTDYITSQKLMRYIFSAPTLFVHVPLEDWTQRDNKTWIDSLGYVLSTDRKFIYHKIGESQWHWYLQKLHSRHSYFLEYIYISKDPINNLIMTRVAKYNDRIQVLSVSHGNSDEKQEENVLTFDNIDIIKPKIDWFTTRISASSSTSQLLAHVIIGTAYG